MFSTLAIDWLPFLTSVFLLWLPVALFLGKDVRYRELNSAWQGFTFYAVTLPGHWLDGVRAGAATFFLCNAVDFSRSLGLEETNAWQATLPVAGVLTVGVIVQTVVCRAEGNFHVPFAYVFGVTAALFPPVVAALALVVAVLAAIGFRTVAAFLWVLPIGLLGIGSWLYAYFVELSIGAVLSLLAAILPMLFHREFVLAHRPLPRDPEILRDLR